jgi:hypothetical protein
MSSQPIIIQVLSRSDHHDIRRRLGTLGFLTAASLVFALLLALNYGLDQQSVLITGALVRLLLANALFLVRNRLVDRHSLSLCFDGHRCYSVTQSWDTRDWSPVRLHFKGESILIGRDQGTPATEIFAFQVLAREDWQAIQTISAVPAGNNKSALAVTLPELHEIHPAL